ncbi:MAG TPA: molybdopterin-guanine dinucleotide biosynthesis protein B [Desulfotomaculum sp.]|nr:MAG: Molybdopterin-guanine dinucleotide biosynthesis protein B [Desulfotomaculum sp. 46_80]KUK85246.1 MAG: Molybdopterin-guanine dinucleotide biosynthesis protein B [Desulfofundulus kuznetsovii]HAG11140.1 molybdopterin-guanine dinucleotide biosynthesis protein B [Desulfotomaculum sp.]HBY03250.1 molybdopterin-guanine dinucleotide biosynthesis protein B [Desulfotomaculum sp.]
MKHCRSTPLVLCVVGSQNAGKTTLVEKLIAEYKRQGFRVGTVKHHHIGDFEIDYPGKDSWRHSQAGADVVFLSSFFKAAMIKKVEQELLLEQIVDLMGEVDIVLAEGYKESNRPKILVCSGDPARQADPAPEVICTVGHCDNFKDIPAFEPDDVQGLVNFLQPFLKE